MSLGKAAVAIALITAIYFEVAVYAAHLLTRSGDPFDYLSACKEIEGAISEVSEVFYPFDPSYSDDISHWASSSTEKAACSVEPGCAEDVGKILQIVAKNGTPFAVKGGGHTANPHFSSTKGVHIAMSRFADVFYNEETSTVDVGAGLTWEEVYKKLDGRGVNVVGGRVSGPGVAGLILGAGYSWLTNERGLAIDNVEAYDLVLPNGTVTTVTSANDDLFFALKGGFNNFGIVTKFTLKAFPQGDVWGGFVLYLGDNFDQIADTFADFQKVDDPKAAIIVQINTLLDLPTVTLQLFYDGPEPPHGIFDGFLNIPSVSKDVSRRSFYSLVTTIPSQATEGLRAAFDTVSLTKYSSNVLGVIVDQVKSVGFNLTSLFETGTFLSYQLELFGHSMFSYGSNSAYPPSRDRPLQPFNIYYAWASPEADVYFIDAIQQNTRVIKDAALAEGQDIAHAPLYGNYALRGTDLEKIYGANLPRLQAIKAKYDPQNVMGLAGGWKITAS